MESSHDAIMKNQSRFVNSAQQAILINSKAISNPDQDCDIGEHLLKKECFLLGIARTTSPPPSPPPFRATFFGRQKGRFARMIEKCQL